MLEHLQSPQKPARVVILGANGFVAQTLIGNLNQDKINHVALGRKQIDLLQDHAIAGLMSVVQENDILVVIAAEAPCKNASMLYRNIRMMNVVCEVLQKQPVHQVIYISSDAVYADSAEALTESSTAAPNSMHGIMHLTREMMLQSVCQSIPLAILRPSLLYGASDPHNGYGPNKFRRLAAQNQPIVLFGEGEEERDHVYIKDVANIIVRVIKNRSLGILNIVTGKVVSFRQIAEKVVVFSDNKVKIQGTPRQMPMPHNGYRAFDITNCRKAFPDFMYTHIDDGLQLAQSEMQQEVV